MIHTARRAGITITVLAVLLMLPAAAAPRPAAVALEPADTVSGYLARLLINETPFPGERGWVSEADTKAGMLSILWVLHARLQHIPAGYRQEHVAAIRTADIIDVITVGGERGQCDGFYREASGRFVAVPRVQERIDYLLGIANDGEPGRFARLLEYGQGLASAYVAGGPSETDRFARLHRIGSVEVTGRAYSWMTDRNHYQPGGNFVRIPDEHDGSLGGNRFFTLRKLQ